MNCLICNKEMKKSKNHINKYDCVSEDHSVGQTTQSLWIYFSKEDIRYTELSDLKVYSVVQNKKYIHLAERPKNLSLNEFKKYFILD